MKLPVNKPIYILFLILLFWQATVSANDLIRVEYSHRRYTTHDGLPNMLLETLHQDKRGFIWVGTFKGFARFDGFVFTPFLTETSTNILHFESAYNGDVKAYTYQHVFIVDSRDSIRSVRLVPDSLYLNTINTRALPEGYLIYENYDASAKYLMQTENDTVKEILRLPELNRIGDSKPYLDLQDGKLYIPYMEDRSVSVYDMRTHEMNRLDNLSAEAFLKHSRLGLLAIANDGVYKITGHSYEKIADGSFSNLKDALETKEGSILIKDENSVYRMDGNMIELYISIRLTQFWDMLYDDESNLWLATHDGLYNYFHFDFKNHYLKSDVLKIIVEDTEEKKWLGTYYGNLLYDNGNTVSKIDYMKGEHKYRSFLFGSIAAHGLFYFSRDNGVLITDRKRFWWAEIPIEAEYSRIIPYKNEQILILKNTGVFQCDKNGKLLESYPESYFKQEDLHELILDLHGRWIVAGTKGLSIVGDSCRMISNSDTSPTISLCMDNQGRIWSASENRLNVLRNDSIITVHRFPDNFIQDITRVDDEHLLIATLHGIYILDTQRYFASGELHFLLYNHRNGMTGIEPMCNGLYTDKKGIIWMPTNEFLISFDPQKLISKNMPPKLYVLSCESSKNNIHWQKVEYPDKHRFSYKDRNIKFSFIGLKYSVVENVRYSYRLIGFQNEWSKPDDARSVIFNNLNPGHYTFEIAADAGTETSRSEVRRLSFVIRPAFWQTWWFYTLCLVAFVAMTVYLIFNYLNKKNLKKIRILERQKQLNNLQIQSIRLRSIPHFNANVLAGIEYYIMNFSKEEANHYLSLYSSFTNYTLRDVDRPARTLKQEIHYIELYLKLEKMRFGEHFEFSIDVAPNVESDIMLPNMILHTHCENAIKHGLRAKKETGHLHIMVVPFVENEVLIIIEDDGIGREEAKRLDTSGTGQGLYILSQQIELYNQSNHSKITQRFIDLKNEYEHPIGTRIEITVPANYQYN